MPVVVNGRWLQTWWVVIRMWWEHQGLTSRDATRGQGTGKDRTSGPGRTSEEAARAPLHCTSGTWIVFMLVTVQQRKPRVACLRCSDASRARLAGQRTVSRHLCLRVHDVYSLPGYMYLRLRTQHIFIQYFELWICVYFHLYRDMILLEQSPCLPKILKGVFPVYFAHDGVYVARIFCTYWFFVAWGLEVCASTLQRIVRCACGERYGYHGQYAYT